MRWTTKASLFRAFDSMPYGHSLYGLAQRHITKTVPRPVASFPGYLDNANTHIANFRELGGDISTAKYFEFGAGWDLFQPLCFWTAGSNRQLIVDLSALAKLDYVNHVIGELKRNPPSFAVRTPTRAIASLSELLTVYGIEYKAPADARHTFLAPCSIDLVSTTNTLEHIPIDALGEILAELRRICIPTAIVSMRVDYSDHYSHGSAQISPYHFLRYSSQEWAKFNPDIHFQNRLRHKDYEFLFKKAGFEIIRQKSIIPDDWQEQLQRQRLHAEFAHYTPEELSATNGWFVLRPRANA